MQLGGWKCALLAVAVTANCAISVAAEAEAESSDTDFGMGLMLFGCMTFSLASFYLVKSGDGDLELFAWKMLHSTVSIFIAICIFQVADEAIKTLSESLPTWGKLLVDMAHMMSWYVVMQVVMALVSGAVGIEEQKILGFRKSWNCKGVGRELDSENPIKAKAEQDMFSFAGLLGHITGFATINAWSLLQQLVYESVKTRSAKGSLFPMYAAASVVLLAGVFLRVLDKMTRRVRRHIALSDDGLKDWFEEQWIDETKETEDDVNGLAISFLAVQVLKGIIVGVLPNEEGEDEEGASHTAFQILALMATAALFSCLLVEALNASISLHHRFKLHHHHKRVYSTIFNAICMMCAWCVLWSVDWMLPRTDDSVEKLILAVTVSVVAFVSVWTLDKIADRDWTSRRVDKALRDLIQALGVLLGFSWEQCFDYTWRSTVDQSPYKFIKNPLLSKTVLASGMFIIIVPAWYWYIVPTVLKLQEKKRETATPKTSKEEPLLKSEATETNSSKDGELSRVDADESKPATEQIEERLNRVFNQLQDAQKRVRQLEELI